MFMKSWSVKDLIVSVLSVALLGGIAVDMHTISAPDDAGPYQKRIAEVVGDGRQQIGDWLGENIAIPRGAIQLLRPNAVVSKQYTNQITGRHASFLLVQVSDARALLGHYPPICYKVQGYTPGYAEPHDWRVGDMLITGMEYRFDFRTFERSESKLVMNFMIMPDGTFKRDMDAVEAQAADLRKRFYGAAQVQVVVDASCPESERDQVFGDLIGGYRDVIREIRAGAKQP